MVTSVSMALGKKSGERNLNIQIRLSDELFDRLEIEREKLGMSRSGFCRMLITQGLGDPTMVAVLNETYYKLQPVIRRVIGRAVRSMNESLPELLEEELSAVESRDFPGPSEVGLGP